MKEVCEYIAIEISLDHKNAIFVISLYRPPNTDLKDFNLKLTDFLEKLTLDKKKKIFIAGDLNIDLLKSDQHADTEEFLNTLLSFSFLPTITRPTRITENTSTLLDNIFANCFENVSSSHIVYDDISDHLPTILALNVTQPPNVLDFKKEDIKK